MAAKLFKALLWTVGIVLVVGVVLRLALFRPWVIPADPVLAASIAPTLAGGDRVLVLIRGTPGFGDLVRCPDPEEPTRWVVGRIVGVGGDKVVVEEDQLTVNNTRYLGESACAERKTKVIHPFTGSELDLYCDIVTMGGGWHYRGTGAGPKQSRVAVDVPDGKVYLLSDNRGLHDDSRDFGVVEQSTCKEQIVLRLTSKAGWLDDKQRMTFIH
ncbi:MAG: signal peptidase I [Polyangiaceae bacterium]